MVEKFDARKSLSESRGDLEIIPAGITVLGWKTIPTKKGSADVVEFRMPDGIVVAVFADQLRKDGDNILVSASMFKAQEARARKWAAGGMGKSPD